MAAHQRVATKDDYIYIPLKGTNSKETTSNNADCTNNNSSMREHSTTNINTYTSSTSSSKPPLPKQPPRVVHASVKKDKHDGDVEHRHRRRRTIDSSSSAGSGNCLPMEPIGLIETDLDTEVTVITCGANVKTTRSLLDLGPQPRIPRASQEKHEKSSRPHKSMEFLLDKENLKVVEVSLMICLSFGRQPHLYFIPLIDILEIEFCITVEKNKKRNISLISISVFI